MSIIREKEITEKSILNTAFKMVVAARTAPKGKGRNTLEIMILDGDDIKILSQKMKEQSIKYKADFFSRDADNLEYAQAVVLIGSRIKTLGLNEMCQLCGFKNCKENNNDQDMTRPLRRGRGLGIRGRGLGIRRIN